MWTVVLAAGILYLYAHRSVLATRPAGELIFPWPHLPAARGDLAPWLILIAALAGGGLVARCLVGAAPRAVVWGIGAYACLVVPAHALELLGWARGRPLFWPWNWSAAIAMLVLILAALPRPRPKASVPPRPERARDALTPWLWLAALAVAGLHAHAVGRTIRHGARAWDGESYHLPVPLQWIHVGSLTEPLARQVVFSRWELDRFANPGNGHLLMSLPLLVGWDLFACLVQLPFLGLAAWAVAALAGGAGASRAAAGFSALAFLAAPMVAEQAAVPMLDLVTAALSLAAVAMLFVAAEEPAIPMRGLALAGLGAGLALGTKTTALPQLLLVALVVGSSRWTWRAQRSRTARGLAAFVALLILPAAFWYLRSGLLFGNPIHPVRLELFGHTLAPGMSAEDMSGTWDLERMKMKTRAEWPLFPFRDPEYSDETGFGALLATAGALGLCVGTLELGRGLRQRRFSAHSRLALLLLTALAVFWFVAARTPRFNLPLLGIAASLSGPGLDALGAGFRRHAAGLWLAGLAAATLVLSLQYHGWDMGPPFTRKEVLEADYPGIPAGIDALPASVIFNDTSLDESSRPSNYKLFGADHRHLVYDHPQLPVDDPRELRARLQRLGAGYVFLRIRKTDPLPPRYAAPAFEAVLDYEGREYRGTLLRVR